MLKEAIVNALNKNSKEISALLWKWGLWFVVLILVTIIRILYEYLYGERHPFSFIVLQFFLCVSIGTTAIILCALYQVQLHGIWLVIASILMGEKIIKKGQSIELVRLWEAWQKIKESIDFFNPNKK
jgi:hypothetical protein